MRGICGLVDFDRAASGTPKLGRDAFQHAATGCLIAADARIDYRDELCKALMLDPAATSDPQLIVSAYLRWGDACLDHLLGDFAFALWDPRQKRLLCARDHFGMRPLYYHHRPGARFVCAPDARQILAIPGIPRMVNMGRVADFLVPELEWIDYTSTFYEQVHRLPPGHKLEVTATGMSISEYWEPAPGPAPAIKSDGEWIDALLEVLTRAVDERLREPSGQVGSMLSGGMDSGSIAALASEVLRRRGSGPLRTFSAAQGPHVECEETSRIRATAEWLGVTATVLEADAIGDFDDELLSSIEEPFDGEFLFMKALFMAARREGLAVLLDGGGGDVVLHEGTYVTRLIRQGQLPKAFGEILQEQSFWGGDRRYSALAWQVLKALTPELPKRAWRRWRRPAGARNFVATSIISPDFARSVDIDARFERMHQMFPADWIDDAATERIRRVRPNVAGGRERYQRVAASAGMEARDPFLDLKVARFCAHVPGHWLLRDGWPKYILREAMAGRLPDQVRWGRGKPHIGWLFNQRFLEREMTRGNLSLRQIESTLEGLVDAAALERGWERFLRDRDPEAIHRAYVLSRWLGKTPQSIVVEPDPIG